MNAAGNSPRRWRPATLVYAAMVALTLVTWAIGLSGASGLGVSLLVLSLALLKGQMVGDWFIGLHPLRSIWRWVIALWLLVPGTLIAIAFILAERN